MKGLLFYDAVGAKRNEWFIGRLTEAANALGHELELVIFDGKLPTEISCDFAVVRTIAPELTKHLESLGIPCFNNGLTSRVANDKWQTYLFAKGLGIPLMHTVRPRSYDEMADDLGLPFVIKTVDGHGGSEVFLVENEQKCKELFSYLSPDKLIAQAMCSEPGADMRVYVLGGEILAAAKRISHSDFRSNFSLGGEARIVDVPEGVKGVISKIAGELVCDFVGIDFIRHEGEWVLNEIEDVVGTRMLYSLTDIDAAQVYVEYILNRIEKTHL